MPENKKRILFIEDEESLRSVMKTALESAGFDVKIAVDGQEALREMIENEFDLILMDIILPKMSGFEILENLSMEKKEKTPIIIFSVSTEPLPPEKMKAMGIRDWIIKSDIDPEEIIAKINKYIK